MNILKMRLWQAAAICSSLCLASELKAAEPIKQEPAVEPTRIIIECEDMKGVAQDKFGPASGWQVGRWGHDLYQNMIFGGPWASRLRNAMTDSGDNPAEVSAEIDVPADGKYKVWVKYECPPYFNYAFGIRIEPVASESRPVFSRTYGLRESAKHFCFNSKLVSGDLIWTWGIDNDAAEGYEETLSKGRYRVVLEKVKNPVPAGARSIDTIMITSDLSELSAPKMPRYPLLDELRRANHVYFRFRNPKEASAPIKVSWDHWGHRPNDYYYAQYRDLVKFYDANGNPLPGNKAGIWPEPIAPGQASPWYDLGPTMNTESSSPYSIRGLADKAKPTDPSMPIAVDIALEPNESKILKSFELGKGESALTILVQPDLFRREGVEFTRKVADIYKDVASSLNRESRLGPIPKKLRLYAGTGSIWGDISELPVIMGFREALGLNTIPSNTPPKDVPAYLKYSSIIPRSLSMHHSQDPAKIIKHVKEGGVENQFRYVSYGDEIGLPAIDVKDPAKVEEFRTYLKAIGETPESLGLANWEQVKPLAKLSGDVAVQIGVLPKEKQNETESLKGLNRLYWHSVKFSQHKGIESFAAKTREIKAALGNDVQTSANLGSMHPFYWMHQSSFIDSFKGNAMSLAWSEDYTYCQPEGSRLVADFETAYLRKGASYHDTPMQFYCMPHWPGNTPEYLMQCAVMEWGQNVKDLDFFIVSPDAFSTENYVTYRGGMPIWKTIRNISGMAGLIEDHLLPARTEPAKVAMLLSEASDIWELEGKGQNDVKPGSIPTNVSQEERKALWYALRNAGYRVDMITEDDCKEGLLKNYSALYVCGQNLEHKVADAVKNWVRGGGSLFATAGAARKDEFDAPLTTLDEVMGRGKQVSYQRYRGQLRAKLELLFEKPLDQMTLSSGGSVKALCSLEEFEAAKNATVLATGKNGKPAWISNEFGKGRAFYTGTLPGQAYLQAGLPLTPCGKGGSQTSPWMTESVTFDKTAASVILYPLQQAAIQPDVKPSSPGVVTNRLKSDKSTVITVVNLGQQINGNLKDVEFEISGVGNVKRAWSCFHSNGSLPVKKSASGITVTLPTLNAADVIILE